MHSSWVHTASHSPRWVCFRGCAQPLSAMTPRLDFSNDVYEAFVSLFHSLGDCTISSGLCARAGGSAVSSSSVCTRHARCPRNGTSARLPPPRPATHNAAHTFYVAAGVQFKKLLVWSQFGPITNDVGNIWRCGRREPGWIPPGRSTAITFDHHKK